MASPESNSPLILFSPTGPVLRVVACSREARRYGVRPRMTLAEAQSLWPAANKSVRFEPHNPRADLQTLRELAWSCHHFSPLVALDDAESPDCLLLDVTGCGYGFGGEDVLAKKIAMSMRQRGYQVNVAIADTVGAAWAVAHFSEPTGGQSRIYIIPTAKHSDILRFLPIEALRLPPPIIETLHDLRIRRVEQLLVLPRFELPSRFGPELLLRLDQALDRIAELLIPEHPPEPIDASWEFDPPIGECESLLAVIDHLLEYRLAKFDSRSVGVQRLRCSLQLVTRETVSFGVELLRPTASRRRLLELIRLNAERLQIQAEVVKVSLRIPTMTQLEFRQTAMFDSAFGGDEMAELMERLNSRLGEKAVLRPRLEPDPQPEFAWGYGDILGEPSRVSGRVLDHVSGRVVSRAESGRLRGSARQELVRPSHLLRCPEHILTGPAVPPTWFRWNRRRHAVAHAWGPERIETGWWREIDVRRDYYLVETTTGDRFWLFRSLTDGAWFLHGCFA